MNVLLTCAGRRNYLVHFFREALGGRGKVLAADVSDDAPALREADESIRVPPVAEPSYIDALLTVCRDKSVRLLVPLNDLELPHLAKAKQRFDDIRTIALISSPEVVDICFDKWKTVEFLRKCGLDAPQTYLTLADVRGALERKQLAFPLVVKPRWGSASIGIEVVEDDAGLRSAFGLLERRLPRTILSDVSQADRERSVLVQELLCGVEHGLDVVNDLEATPVATFARRKIAMRAGETDRAVTVHDADLARVGHRLGAALGHVGVLDCDVFVTPRGPVVLELNPRFGGGYPFSHVAGANVPAALIAWAQGSRADPSWLQVAPDVRSAKCDRLVKL